MIRKQNNFAFIDNQNLFAALKECGWELDYQKFYVFLREKYSAKRIFVCIGFIPNNIRFYEKLYSFGYEFVFKPVLTSHGIIKGNCDADLILHAIFRVRDYDKAVIISGDGDFHCLVEYLLFKDKLEVLIVPDGNRHSALLKKYRYQTHYLNEFEKRLSLQKKSPDKDGTL